MLDLDKHCFCIRLYELVFWYWLMWTSAVVSDFIYFNSRNLFRAEIKIYSFLRSYNSPNEHSYACNFCSALIESVDCNSSENRVGSLCIPNKGLWYHRVIKYHKLIIRSNWIQYLLSKAVWTLSFIILRYLMTDTILVTIPIIKHTTFRYLFHLFAWPKYSV